MNKIIIRMLDGWVKNKVERVEKPEEATRFDGYHQALKFIEENDLTDWKIYPEDALFQEDVEN